MLALLATAPSAFSGLATAPPRANVAMVFGAKSPATKPTAKATGKPAATRKPAAKPAAKKAVVKKAAPKPAAKKPVAKPAAKKPAYKPVAKKSNFQKPASRPARNQWDRKPVAKGQKVNLRVPAPKQFAYGLPGSYNIIGGTALEFDPYGFLDGKTELEVNRYRECELTHGRVGMLAAVGFIVQENFHPLFSGVGGPAIDQIPQLPFWWWAAAGFGITFCEFFRISIAFRELNGETLKAETALRPGYTPGQIGFDPAGFAPDDPAEFRLMQEKELAHARLGMIAAAGFLAQEAVTKTTWAAADGLF